MRTTVLVLFILISFCQPCLADETFNTFWTQFKSAVEKRDKNAVASMTKLPFLFDSKNLGKTEFIAKLDKVIPKNVSACFKREKPILDNGEYLVFCGETIYVFSKVKGKYLFSDIGVND